MRRWLIAEQPRFWLPSRTARLRSRRPEKVREALALRAEGCATKTIARRLGIARSTVRYWLDRCAGVAQSAEAIGLKPIQCGFDSHHQHQAEYAYLLGMYLGDGCISRMPRTYVLRIFLHRKQIDVIERVNHALRSLLPDHRVGYVLAVTMPVSPSRPTSTDGPIFFLTTVWGVSTHAPSCSSRGKSRLWSGILSSSSGVSSSPMAVAIDELSAGRTSRRTHFRITRPIFQTSSSRRVAGSAFDHARPTGSRFPSPGGPTWRDSTR